MPSPDFDRVVDRTGTASLKWGRYGPDVLPLWVADMDFEAPAPVIEAVQTLASHGVYGYAHMPDSLLEAITTHLAATYSWAVHPDWIVYTPGVVPALNVVCRAYAGLGEGVMTLIPAYPPFLEAPPNQERRLQTVSARLDETGRWRMPLEEMERVVDGSTRVLLLCHPQNPLGRAWERAELEIVVDFCRRHDLVLCSDEIHCDLLLDLVEHVPATLVAPDADAFTVTLMSPSKTFNVPGLNFAYAIIPDARLRQAFKQAARGLFSLPGCFSVVAAEACYRGGGPWLAALLEYLRGNRAVMEEWVAGLGSGITTTHVEATYLAWLDVRALGSEDPAAHCVAAGVGLSDGRAFGTPGFLRLNFGCPRSTLETALRRLDDALG